MHSWRPGETSAIQRNALHDRALPGSNWRPYPSAMYRRGMIGAVVAMALVAMIFVVQALDRESTLTNAVAIVPPDFPPAVSATSVPVASASAASTPPIASATSAPPSASATTTAPPLPVVAFLGDDFTSGAGATSQATRWTSLVAAHYGWDEKNFGVAGTGYSTGGTAGGTPYTARIAALVATAPSIVVVTGGRFDIESTNGPTKIKAGVTATFTALRAALPNATIIAESPVWPLTKAPATLALVAADVKAAVASVHGRYVDIGQPLFGLSADIGPHALPNDAGHAALAKAFETAYRS